MAPPNRCPASPANLPPASRKPSSRPWTCSKPNCAGRTSTAEPACGDGGFCRRGSDRTGRQRHYRDMESGASEAASALARRQARSGSDIPPPPRTAQGCPAIPPPPVTALASCSPIPPAPVTALASCSAIPPPPKTALASCSSIPPPPATPLAPLLVRPAAAEDGGDLLLDPAAASDRASLVLAHPAAAEHRARRAG